jgi:hypothetical protein
MTSLAEGDGRPSEPLGAPVMDLTRLSWNSLLSSDDGALTLCLQRLIRDLDDPDGVISAFGNVP